MYYARNTRTHRNCMQLIEGKEDRIRFCPHCGEEIQIHVSEEQDLSGKYQELSKERAELWKQCQKTDSKKKEAQLQDQVHELDRKINQYWELSDIEDLNYAN